MTDIDIFKYLPEDQQRVIAEKVFTEKMEAEVARIIEARHGNVNGNPCGQIVDHIMHRLTDEYTTKMKPEFFDRIMSMADDEIARTGPREPNGENDTVLSAINWALQNLAREQIQANKEELGKKLYTKILLSCDEMMLNAFCADIIRTLNLDKVIKEVLRDKARGYVEQPTGE